MILTDACFTECINSPIRNVLARVELYEGDTLVNTFNYDDLLKEFTVERTGEGKFFGYGISQKINVKVLDVNKELNITTANTLEAVFGTSSEYQYTFPAFKVSEVRRDDTTNELSITAYDALYEASKYTVEDIVLAVPYTIADFATACAAKIGLPFGYENINDDIFSLEYERGANFSGTESLRDALNAIAEATQTIYYINHDWQLTFKRLDRDGEAVTTIDKEKYFTLDSSTNRRLTEIFHTTELGDNTLAYLDISGTTQFVRDNPFWNNREDTYYLVNNALTAIGGLTINQFSCDWRGNYLVELGDKIDLVTKDNSIVTSYLLNDTISFNGGLQQHTEWSYSADEETEENPSGISDTFTQTYARVDKLAQQIDLVTSQIETNSQNISSLQLTADSINASVIGVETLLNEELDIVNEEITEITSRVDAAITAEDVNIQITTALDNGVEKVVTSTGFTFNDEGLRIAKTGTEMETAITENGMQVFRNSEAVLTADNEGVKAEDLHATTYLIIGGNSRFENYGTNRVGCFWIGGNS